MFNSHKKRDVGNINQTIVAVFFFYFFQTVVLSLLRLYEFLHAKMKNTSSYKSFSYNMWKLLSRVRLFATPWTIQTMEFSRPEYWSGLPFPSPGELPNPGFKPRSPALHADSLLSELPGNPLVIIVIYEYNCVFLSLRFSVAFCCS